MSASTAAFSASPRLPSDGTTRKKSGYAVESDNAGDVEVGEICGMPEADNTELAPIEAPEHIAPTTRLIPSSTISWAAYCADTLEHALL